MHIAAWNIFLFILSVWTTGREAFPCESGCAGNVSDRLFLLLWSISDSGAAAYFLEKIFDHADSILDSGSGCGSGWRLYLEAETV